MLLEQRDQNSEEARELDKARITGETIGFQKGFSEGTRSGVEFAQREGLKRIIRLLQRFLKLPISTMAELHSRTLEELEILATDLEKHLPTGAT